MSGETDTNDLLKVTEALKRQLDDFKNKKDTIKRKHENLQTIFNSLPVGIMLITKDKKIVQLNNTALELLECNRDDVLNRTCNKTFCPFVEKTCPVLDLGSQLEKTEQVIMTKKGRVKNIIKSVIPIELDGNELYMESMIDISERKRSEQKLLEERNHAELYLDLLGHDISNFNQAILSYSELMLNAEDMPEKYKKYIENSYKQASAIRDLIVKVRKLTNFDLAEQQAKIVDIHPLILSAIELVENSYPDKKIEISHDLPGAGFYVMGNDLLNDVFQNILSNSVKFNREETTNIEITHTALEDEGSYKFEFKDNGPGIPDDSKDKIFKRLHRGEKNIIGTGIGLTIAQEVISQFDGLIWVEDRIKNDYTQGANFVIVLPQADSLLKNDNNI